MNLRDAQTQAERAGRSPADLLREHLERRVPAGRMGTPDEVAAAFTYLASREGAFVTGHVLTIDGGESIA